MLSWFIEGLFGVWFLLSLLVHIPALRAIRRWGSLNGLLPNWYLFTAQVLMRDLCLRCRDEAPQGQTCSWRDVPMQLPRRFWRFIWNPQRRLTKAILDSADAMIQARLRGVREQALKSFPYRILLRWSSRYSPPGSSLLQFCIALRSSRQETPRHEILFLSPFVPRDDSMA